MFIDKRAPILHVVRFRKGPMVYMTTTHNPDLSTQTFNNRLRGLECPNAEFQTAYELAKVELGLLNPDPNEILFHQFISTQGLTGYGTGHWLLRDYLARNDGLDAIANVGDWLSDEGYIDVTPPDQDARKFIRVTDIGKYYAEKGYFSNGVYPLYILASENNQISASGSEENHRNEQPKRGGYDRVFINDESGKSRPITYNDLWFDISPEDEHIINDKPISAGGKLYSNINQFAHAHNLPTWFVLDQIKSVESQRYAFSQDWAFV